MLDRFLHPKTSGLRLTLVGLGDVGGTVLTGLVRLGLSLIHIYYSMASNYNRVPRPAVVMIGEHGPYEAVRRESLDDLLANDL